MPRAAKTTLPLPVFQEPAFNEFQQTVDPTGFATPHPSDKALYKALGSQLEKDVVSFDKSRMPDGQVMNLADAYGDHGKEVVAQIQKANKIIFHALGDSGASNAGKYKNEIKVADQLTTDCHSSNLANHPAFLFHLGDVVYDFGESQYYYDQFYDSFRNYPVPIFAIPGNHDSFITPNTPKGSEPLTIFSRNFCSPSFTITPEARSLHRTAMTQPGVYFTLDAPFVRIIGLFSNSLEDPGVIAPVKGKKGKTKWGSVPDYQLAYLAAQLKRAKTENYGGALLIAVHHPPFSYSPPPAQNGRGGNHGCSLDMLHQIDTACVQAGVYPHALLCGHAHNYQRYTRTLKFAGKQYQVPFIVCGDGGHNVTHVVQGSKGHPAQEPYNGANVGYLDSSPVVDARGLVLEKHDDTNYGYLRVTVDSKQLKIGFHQVGTSSIAQSRFDCVTVNLASHTLTAN
jgi:calcineurin-like phosphoesterase family protein